jgi:RNA 2',3'-cyclic 3'-phosphodiesterase
VRLFVAVVPPDDVLASVAALPRPEVAGLRWTTREQWHITLRFLGRVDDAGPVVDALSSVSVTGFDAVVGPVTGRFGRRVVHVPVAGLEPLAAAVIDATASFGQAPDKRPFAGHLTLARSRHGRSDLRPLEGAPIAARWPVEEFVLFESQLHPHGARYSVVERFALEPDR